MPAPSSESTGAENGSSAPSSEASATQTAPDSGAASSGDLYGFRRRDVLAALGGTTVLSVPNVVTASSDTATLHVRAYPGPAWLSTWLRNDATDLVSGWFDVHRDALEAVTTAVETVAAHAERHSSLGRVDTEIERGEPIDRWLTSHDPVEAAMISQTELLDAFRDELHARDAITGSTCHLLLWSNALNYDLGYGGTRQPNHHVGAVESEGSQTVANIGATDIWDSRAVTRNIAIHETLHTFLSDEAVHDVVGSSCDHNLGTAVQTDDSTLEISPMATAYAGPDRIDGGTHWHGTGCYDHAAFSRHDGLDGIDDWEYTTQLSEATLNATTRYIEQSLASIDE